jgi:hypothetical protein
VNLTTTTPYGVDSMIGSTVGFPVWFDEYRGGAREDSMGRLRQMLRDAYNGQTSMKGGMTANATELTEVSTWAGIVVSGEMGTQETSLRDRCLMIDLDKDGKNRRAWEWLRADPKRTEGLGYALLEFLADYPDVLFRITPQGMTEAEPEMTRFNDTLGFVETGWQAWLAFRAAQGLNDRPVGPDYSTLGRDRREIADPWLDAIRACVGVSTRDGAPIVEETVDGIVLIPSEIIVEARRIGIELPAKGNELVSWLKRRYEVSDHRIGMSRRRAKIVKGMTL